MEFPGAVLEKKLKECGMSRKELSTRTGVTEKHICTVLNGDRGISTAFARKLGYVFENTAFWANLQAEYDNEQLRLQEENAITAEEIAILKPLHEIILYFVGRGYMHNNCGDVSKVMQLRVLLNISDLTQIPKITYNAAYRAQLSTNVRVDPYVLFAWQRLCEKETENIPVNTHLDKEMLKAYLPKLKSMMFGNIGQGIQELQELLGKCGIAFQVVRNFRGAPVQGFIKETSAGRMILCLTIRRQRADSFWFTLFHEIAHILYGDYTIRFVDFDSTESGVEERANVFSRDILIAPDQYYQYIRTNDCSSWASIEQFAEKIGVQPFIVLGRLQKDGILDWSDYSNKVVKYVWA